MTRQHRIIFTRPSLWAANPAGPGPAGSCSPIVPVRLRASQRLPQPSDGGFVAVAAIHRATVKPAIRRPWLAACRRWAAQPNGPPGTLSASRPRAMRLAQGQPATRCTASGGDPDRRRRRRTSMSFAPRRPMSARNILVAPHDISVGRDTFVSSQAMESARNPPRVPWPSSCLSEDHPSRECPFVSRAAICRCLPRPFCAASLVLRRF